MKNKLKLDKPNQLISIMPKSKINLIQQKCFNVFLRTAQRSLLFGKYKDKEIKKETRYLFDISCKDLKKAAGLKIKDYSYLKEELKKLAQIMVEVTDSKKDDHWIAFTLLEEVERKGSEFAFALHPLIMRELKEHNYFTKIKLKEVAKLNSKYAVIIYEMALRYFDEKNTHLKIPKMEIEKMRKITSTTDKYKSISDFRRYIIDSACEEVNEKTNLNIEYELLKTGRKYTHIDFKVEKEGEIRKGMGINKLYSIETNRLFQLLPEEEKIQENKEELDRLLEYHSFDYLKEDIEYTKEYNPENFMAFLKSSANDGHYSSREKKKKAIVEENKKQEKENKMKENLKDKISKKAHEKAIEKYDSMSEKERENYTSIYNDLPKFIKNKPDVSKKTYIIAEIREEIEKEMFELYDLINE